MRVRVADGDQLRPVSPEELNVVRAPNDEKQDFTGKPPDGALLHVFLAVLGVVLGEGDDVVSKTPHGHHTDNLLWDLERGININKSLHGPFPSQIQSLKLR